MKSNLISLKSRGYIESNTEPEFQSFDFKQKTDLLLSEIPLERSLGARLLASENNPAVVGLLIESLKKEKKLYSKIEICNALIVQGKPAIKPLIALLGKIGNNQYKDVPQIPFNKKSYPLPRDIAARTLAYMGITALPELISVLETADKRQLSDAIDAIGYICFYDYNKKVYEKLISCFARNEESDLIRWKIIRAMSAFPESKGFLTNRLKIENNYGIKLEIERSLKLINSRK